MLIQMSCIFCKASTDRSLSVEHIIPESLGNTEHVLPKGWVCDSCNNYLARKVEKPFLDSLYGRSSRFEMAVPNKRTRIPSVTGIHAQSRTKIELMRSLDDNSLSIGAAEGEDEASWVTSLQSHPHGTLYIPTPSFPAADITTARFIGKVAVEILAHRVVNISGANHEMVHKPELDELRRYVRTGQPATVWPVRMRRIYSADFAFNDSTHGPHQVLHEFTLMLTPESECYAIIAIFGIEYAINLGGPELEGYDKWLKRNDNRSPLYPQLST